jgi:hypothetical protein
MLYSIPILTVVSIVITFILTNYFRYNNLKQNYRQTVIDFTINNFPLILGFLIVSIGSIGFLQYHNKIFEGWIVFRQWSSIS